MGIRVKRKFHGVSYDWSNLVWLFGYKIFIECYFVQIFLLGPRDWISHFLWPQQETVPLRGKSFNERRCRQGYKNQQEMLRHSETSNSRKTSPFPGLEGQKDETVSVIGARSPEHGAQSPGGVPAGQDLVFSDASTARAETPKQNESGGEIFWLLFSSCQSPAGTPTGQIQTETIWKGAQVMQSVVTVSQGSKWRMGLWVDQNKWGIPSIFLHCFALFLG